jgi:hypothetical protein
MPHPTMAGLAFLFALLLGVALVVMAVVVLLKIWGRHEPEHVQRHFGEYLNIPIDPRSDLAIYLGAQPASLVTDVQVVAGTTAVPGWIDRDPPDWNWPARG